jgi:hypothetical protein
LTVALWSEATPTVGPARPTSSPQTASTNTADRRTTSSRKRTSGGEMHPDRMLLHRIAKFFRKAFPGQA